MILSFYMDHHVPRVITQGLRARGIDVLTAFEDGADRLSDGEILDRATQLKRVLFTQDYDFLAETANRQANGRFFYGVIYAHQTLTGIGLYIRELELIAKAIAPEELFNQVVYLPLK